MADKILIIDDDVEFLDFITRFLQKNFPDTEVIGEQDPSQAIRAIRNGGDYAAIIVDVKMPFLDGYETAKLIRSFNIMSPIIFLTALPIDQIESHSIPNLGGATDILVKDPENISNSLLINKIKLFIENSKYHYKRKIQSEVRYKYIFDNAPCSLFEEDLHEIKLIIDGIVREVGIENLRKYLDLHPAFVENCMDKIRITEMNQKAIDIFEAASADDLKTNLKKIFLPQSKEIFKDELVAMAKNLPEFRSKIKYTTLKGNEIDAELYIKLPDGADIEEYKFVVVSINDLSSVVNLEKKTQYLYSALVKSPAVVIKFNLKMGWVVEYMSDNIMNLTGYSSDDFVSGKMQWRARIHPEDVANVESELLSIPRGSNREISLDYRIFNKKMEPRWIKMIVSFDDASGSYQGIVTDITKEIILQKKISDTLEKWKMLMESTKTAYIIMDAEGKILEVNNQMAKIAGCENNNVLVGANLKDLVCPEDAANYDRAIKKINLTGENIEDLEVRLQGSEKLKCSVGVVWVEINAGLMENGNKKIFCLVRDITENKTKEIKKFIDNQKQKDKIIQSISKMRNNIKDMRERNI